MNFFYINNNRMEITVFIVNVSLKMNFLGVRVMVFNATFNNISVISLRSVLFVEETGVPEENHRPDASQ